MRLFFIFWRVFFEVEGGERKQKKMIYGVLSEVTLLFDETFSSSSDKR